MKSWEQLLLPLPSLVPKDQRWSSNPTITHSRRWSLYLHSFHQSLITKLNVLHHPRLNPNHVPLASQTPFLRKKTYVPWTFLNRLWRPRGGIPHMSMKTSLSKPLKFYARFWSPQSWPCLVLHAFTRTITKSISLFQNFLGEWLWMHMFIRNITDLVEALWY